MIVEVCSVASIWKLKLKQLQIKENLLRENRLTPSLVKNLSIHESRNLDKVAIIDILIPLDIDIKMSFAGEKHFQNIRFLLVYTVAILLL